MSTAGYSSTPLATKLGIKPGNRVKIRHAPKNFLQLLAPLPAALTISSRLRRDIDVWHLFTRSKAQLQQTLPQAMAQINRDGMIWVSWPKKSAGVPSTVTENTVREVALPLGLVDVKVCAIDETWSGLKLVIRKALR